LIELAEDRDEMVREVAWTALGLGDSRGSREHIARVIHQEARNSCAWIVAAGLMRDPPRSVLNNLMHCVRERKTDDLSQINSRYGIPEQAKQHAVSANPRQMALWALRTHEPAGLDEVAESIVRKSADDLFVAEALVTLGAYQPRSHDTVTLLDKAFLAPWEGALPSTKRTWRDGNAATHERMGGVRVAAVMSLSRYDRPVDDPHGRRARRALRSLFEESQPVFSNGVWPQYKQAYLRSGSTTNVFFGFKSRFAALGLGQIGYAEEAELITEMLRRSMVIDVSGQVVKTRYFPRRGFAALGLGHYLRRMSAYGLTINDDQVAGDRRVWLHGGRLNDENADATRHAMRRALRTLVDVGSDAKEPENLRAACVLALGLTESADRRADIKTILLSPGGKSDLVRAYGVLALALLEDPEAIKLADSLLGGRKAETLSADEILKRGFRGELSLEALVARLAVIEGLALIGTEDAAALLRGQFGRDVATSMEIARALRTCGVSDLAEPLAELLDQHNKPKADSPKVSADVAAMCAWSLGQLLRRDGVDRFAEAMLRDANITQPIAPMGKGFTLEWMKERVAIYRYRCYADPVLFEVLVPVKSEFLGRL
jgi:hypothetical protein